MFTPHTVTEAAKKSSAAKKKPTYSTFYIKLDLTRLVTSKHLSAEIQYWKRGAIETGTITFLLRVHLIPFWVFGELRSS